MTSLLEILNKSIFSGVPSDAAWDLIKVAWQKVTAKSWEELYLDAFDTALSESSMRLSGYTRSGEVSLDRSALHRALHRDLQVSVNATPPSTLYSEEFVTQLADAMSARSALIIGGHKLSQDDYRQLVRNLVSHATARFRTTILTNESAFRHALLAEATNKKVTPTDQDALFDQTWHYLRTEFHLVQSKLDDIGGKVNFLFQEATERQARMQLNSTQGTPHQASRYQTQDDIEELKSIDRQLNTLDRQVRYHQESFRETQDPVMRTRIDSLNEQIAELQERRAQIVGNVSGNQEGEA